MQKSWRITRASKSLEFHPGKKEIGEWVGRGDIPRLDSYYSSFSKWTTTSRTYPARHARNFGRGDPYADSSRVAPESNVGERETWWRGIDERTFVPPPPFTISRRTKEERRKKSFRIRDGLVPHASSQRPFVERGTIDSNFHAHGRKGGKVVAFSCGTFYVLCSLTFSFV